MSNARPLGIESLKHLVLFAAALNLGYHKAMANGSVGFTDIPTIFPLIPKAAKAVEHIGDALPEFLDLDQGEAIELVEAVQQHFGDILPPGAKASAIAAAALKAVPNIVGVIRACTLDGPPVAQIVEPAPGVDTEDTPTEAPPAAAPATESPPAEGGPGNRGEGE